MNFLDLIWLIPLFPLCGAAIMLLIGRKLDPQAASEVAVGAGRGRRPVTPGTGTADAHGHGHDHGGRCKLLVIACSARAWCCCRFIFSAGRGVPAFAAARDRPTR